MASESSSAVLDLNDVDTEDTDAGTVTEDNPEGAPLIMDNGYDIAVMVDAPMKQLSTLETFVTYRVRCVCARWQTPPFVRRRFNHFKVLHKRLSTAHPLLAAPPLPPAHSARQQLDRYSPSFVAVRTQALYMFLDRVAKHPIFTHSEDFRLFLTTPDEELDKIFKSENSALNLWGLSSAFYANNDEAKPVNGARVKDPEFTSTAEYLTSLQHKLTALCSLTTKLYAQSAALAQQLTGMKRACDAWSTQCGGCSLPLRALSRAVGRAGAPPAPLAPPPAGGAGSPGGALSHAALLPLLAAYAQAHVEKIRHRDAIHAAHVAGNTTGDVHNRLEQASEALRSELSDWIPKTRADIKSLLLNLADRQVAKHTQSLMGWEEALKMANERNSVDLFKTVSKTAVQNLSPSKCQNLTPNETENDVDFDYSNDDDDEFVRNGDLASFVGKDLIVNDSNESNVDFESLYDSKFESNVDLHRDSKSVLNSSFNIGNDSNVPNSDDSNVESKTLNSNIVNDSNVPNSDVKNSNSNDRSKISDPLQDFSEVDLS